LYGGLDSHPGDGLVRQMADSSHASLARRAAADGENGTSRAGGSSGADDPPPLTPSD
jgi:hypothetical protein